MSRAQRVVVGVVESTREDTIHLDEGAFLLVPREATFRVERTLKGETEPAEFHLRFDPDLKTSSCLDLYQGYKAGTRMLLSLQESAESNSYWAPSIPPWRLHLPSDNSYTETPLYQYAEQLAAQGHPPVSIHFESLATHRPGGPLEVVATIVNEMDSRLSVQINGPEPAADKLTLWLVAEGVSIRSVGLPPPFDLAASATQTVSLGRYFNIASQGRHWIKGFLWLPGGAALAPVQDSVYRDRLQGPFSGIWSYDVAGETAIREHIWAKVKTLLFEMRWGQ